MAMNLQEKKISNCFWLVMTRKLAAHQESTRAPRSPWLLRKVLGPRGDYHDSESRLYTQLAADLLSFQESRLKKGRVVAIRPAPDGCLTSPQENRSGR